tara:strand:- start:9407 stop:10237 length:831 start_codon:yes stop_codon:yes gene_type:complete
MILKSNTKLNLGLRILNRRKDNLHNIATLYTEIDFGDEIQINKEEKGCLIKSNVDWIPLDKSNLCFKAYDLLSNQAQKDLGVSIYINKKVPIGSGIGGGSSNAAAILKGLNLIYNIGFDGNELEKIGSKIGADVPFFIKGGSQIGEETGFKLTPVRINLEEKLLLVIPDISISTKWAYGQIKNKLKSENIIPNFADLMRKNFLSSEFFENDFEKIVIHAYPEIGAIKKKLLDSGAKFASLSGSGSTVYGVYDDEAKLKKAKSFFHNSHLTIPAKPI